MSTRTTLTGLLVLTLILSGCTSLEMAQRTEPPPGDEPIFLVHGFGDTHWSPNWQRLESYLQRLNYDRKNIYRVYLGMIPGTTIQSPKRYAKIICEALHNRYPDRRIDIIAHSMGGLGARWCIQKLNGAGRVDDLITLGTPHQGVRGLSWTNGWFQYFGYEPPGSIVDMRPDGHFINELNQGPLPDSVNFVAVWSTLDYVYFMSEYENGTNAQFPNHLTEQPNVINLKVPFFAGHLDLISDKRVLLLYKDHLD
jgi:pimeloyl-ACP methyl ester carboxylesterase